MKPPITSHEQPDVQLSQRPFEVQAGPDDVAVAADTAMTLGRLTMQFASIERVPRYDEERRENDAEHSFMLALVANELAAQYYPWMDRTLVLEYSLVHDLIELETGDVATFTLTDEELAAKEAAEHRALAQLVENLPPTTARAVIRYELQCSSEARFVRLVDKLLPGLVNIAGPGVKVMAEDFGITSQRELDAQEVLRTRKLEEQFSEPHLAFLHLVRAAIAAQFSEQMAHETDQTC